MVKFLADFKIQANTLILAINYRAYEIPGTSAKHEVIVPNKKLCSRMLFNDKITSSHLYPD